ncbi:MAG: BMC domain-containing protein [Romboutsia sp.]|uniref:BMC domain-containing protein n=1 Tax=Romboutsia sp. TaxID=1965302 RepID=UPI003F3AE53A
MSQLSIGIIETVGLAACIEAADICVKSANVNLIGYELSKGGGMATLKIEGNVGAVKAAIEAAIVGSNKVSSVFASKVIPRPSDGIELLIKNTDTVGYENEIVEDIQDIEDENSQENQNQENDKSEVSQTDEIMEIQPSAIVVKAESTTIEPVIKTEQSSFENEKDLSDGKMDNEEDIKEEVNYTCNLCKDPNCKRQKGELRTSCMHYEELNDFKEE